ncbi:hypothetical protein [Ruegeria sp.]|uniref:hypothetical protein n=1 Tax=Ruegeria sp. TaxID=1879320 RepID=UPI0023136176|nr:hypothetical protein [Ruegeria sp.]MDA7963248.1 hypothetical protein [Ruegeria sp.]
MFLKFLKYFLALIVFLAAAWFWVARPERYPDRYLVVADQVWSPGVINANAVLVDGGEVVAVGTALKLDADGTVSRVEFPGKTVLPGLVEPHTHPIASALLGAVVSFPGDHPATPLQPMTTLKTAVTRLGPDGKVLPRIKACRLGMP